MNTPAPVSGLDALLDEIRRRRGEFQEQQSISPDIIEKFKQIGVYRAFVPKRLGGTEMSAGDFLRLIERIATADGSAGWVASFGVSTTYLAALPPDVFETIYAKTPDVVFAGALFPPQPAEVVAGGLRVSGRWQFGSGSHGASVIGVGIKAKGADGSFGLPRMAVMPRESVRIEDNWDVIGMQGTGSHDLVVDGVTVPENWTFLRGGQALQDGPLFRYPSMALAAQVLAVVGLGVARAALDDIIGVAGGGRASITGAPQLADRAYAQIDIAKAEASLRAARSWFYEVTEQAWQEACDGDAVPVATVNLLRLASTHAARASADAAQTAFNLAGTSAIFNSHAAQRYLHDTLVVAQHAFLAEGTWQSAGRVLLGMPSQPGYP